MKQLKLYEKMSIEVHNLTVSYYGKSVLEDISLQTVDGEILAVLGPSGSGKTTLLLNFCKIRVNPVEP